MNNNCCACKCKLNNKYKIDIFVNVCEKNCCKCNQYVSNSQYTNNLIDFYTPEECVDCVDV